MTVLLTYGERQVFRYRHHDITIRGQLASVAFPVRAAVYALNGAAVAPFYVEQEPDAGVDWVNGYKASPGELRCREQGEFCIEIPIDAPALRNGENSVAGEITGADGRSETFRLYFSWDPEPLPLPLDLRDLRRFGHIQDVGQTVNGAFDLDRDCNLIRSRAPVAPDAFLILGSPHGSQEATFAVRFLEPAGAKWLGMSDFMAGQQDGVPPRGIKVGWSSAGMAALGAQGEARSFIAWGDHSSDPREWAIATHPPAPVAIEKNVVYRVRHQVAFAAGVNRVRFRLWRDGTAEPAEWLCQEDDAKVPRDLPRHRKGSFGLFQHLGMPVEWFDILVVPHQPDADDLPGCDPAISREPFLGRRRPGAF